jgi:hypothetical protein
MARLVDHGDVGRDPFAGQLDAAQQALAPREARRERGLAALLEDRKRRRKITAVGT